MRKVIVVFFLLGCLGTRDVYAQPTEEELLNALKITPKEDHDSIYYDFSREAYYANDFEMAETYVKASLELSLKNSNYKNYTKCNRALGLINHRLENFDIAKSYYYEGIRACIEYDFVELLVYTTNDLGRLFENHDVYDSALKYYSLSLETATRLGMEEDMAIANNNIGLVFYYLDNYSEAIKHHELAIALKKNINASISINLMNLALAYNDQGKYYDALNLLKQVELDCNSCSQGQVADLYFDLGYASFYTENLEIALKYFKKSYEMGNISKNRKVIANTLHYFGKYYIRNNDILLGKAYFDSALVVAKELNLRRLEKSLYLDFYKLYEEEGDLSRAMEFQSRYISLKDSIFNSNVAFNLAAIQLEAQKKQSDLIIQQKEIELSRSRWIIAFVTVMALLLVVIAFLLFNRYRLNRRLKQILQRQVQLRTGDLIQNNEELRQLNLEFEKLLSQTSRYIHGPMATLIGLINLAEKDQSDPERTQKYLAKIKRVAGEMGLSLEQLKQVGKVKEQKQVEDSTLTLEELLKNDV